MNWEYKIFRDNVHGYIRIPIPFLKIIDSDVFQRLRYIEQTGMRILYPSARHDRFIHSLGTYHIGQKAIKAFRENVKLYYSKNTPERNYYNIFATKTANENFWDKSEALFSIACLLHDCGHAPFSHTFEHIYDLQKCNDGRDISVLNEQLLKAYQSQTFIKDFGSGTGKEHERMSALLVRLFFKDIIIEIIKEEFGTCYLGDIEFIARAIIGCKYSEIINNKVNQIRNCMIDLLNSESIDVDGLDYIIRDANLSGVDNVSIDIDRLLNSLTIVEKTHFENCNLDNYKIDHILLNAELNGQLIGNLSGIIMANDFNGSIKGQVCINGKGKIKNKVDFNNGYAKVGGVQYGSTIPDTVDVEKFDLDLILSNCLELEQAKYLSRDKLNIIIDTDQKSFFYMSSVYFKGIINGIFTGEVLGCFHLANTNIEIVLAFHKSSLSVLQNVIYARNYEYQWIYGHHKVVYYSNFLLVHALRQTARFLINENSDVISTDDLVIKMLSMINVEQYKQYMFYRNNDSDLNYLFKLCSMKNSLLETPNASLKSLFKELFTRKYKRSVWKSYAEYNVLFNELSENEKTKLFSTIKINSNSIGTNKLYGFFNEDWNNAFQGFDMNDVVWVSSEVKIKDLDPDKTFILMKDNSMRLKDVSLDNANKKKIDYFYLYYSSEQKLTKENLLKLIDFLKEKAVA